MSKLFRDERGQVVQIIDPNYPKIQTVAVSGSSAQTSNGMPHGCTLAMLVSTTNCWFSTAASAAKDATSIYLNAGTFFYHPCVEGTKFAFIQDSASGTAQVIPAL